MREDPATPVASPHLHEGLTDEAIRNELALILSSPELKTKPTIARFLQFVVEETLAGHAHQIKAFTIALQVLKKNENFDAVRDPSVRILGGRLRSSLERYYSTFGREDPIRIDVPRGAYVPVFRRHLVAETANQPSMPRVGDPETSRPLSPGIAIMPLRNLSNHPEGDYFAEGLAEELTAELVRYQDFSVVPCRTATKMRDSRIDARELGRQLEVRFLLEGSVRMDGTCIKIGFALIDTTTGAQIWGERYRRNCSEVSAIELQDEIASEVAAKIGDFFGIIPRKLTKESIGRTPEALGEYELFLRHREYVFALTEEAFAVALESVDHARERAPHSGAVWAMLANLCADDNTLWSGDLGVSMEMALDYGRRGAVLDPQNQYVRTILAYLHFLVGHRDEFLREVETALQLNPGSQMHAAFIGLLLALQGQWDRGLGLLEKATASSHHYPGWFHMAPCLHLYGFGRFEQAYRQALRIQAPRFLWDPLLRAASLGQMGRSAEARQSLDELLRLRPDFPSGAHHRIGFFVKGDDGIHGLLDGLEKAGLKIRPLSKP